MLEKPDLSDKNILTKLYDDWQIQSAKLDFLPIGNDSNAWVYRVETPEQRYFLKIRKNRPSSITLHVPEYLNAIGIENPVAPIRSLNHQLYVPANGYYLILYRWIDGESAWTLTLSEDQWRTWGAIMRQIHDDRLTPSLRASMPTETFDCKWNPIMATLNHLIQTRSFTDPIQKQFVTHWQEKQGQIDHCHQRWQVIAQQLKAQSLQFVLCHADIHTANIMIDQHERIRIVDWDEVIIAPRERDLMFFVEDGHPSHKVSAFLQGYGETNINQLAITYYRYDWVVQECADYGERILLSNTLSASEKQFALNEFIELFDAGDVVDTALTADHKRQS